MNLSHLYDLFWDTPYWARIIILMVVGPIMFYLGLNQIGLKIPFEMAIIGSWLFTWALVLINIHLNGGIEE